MIMQGIIKRGRYLTPSSFGSKYPTTTSLLLFTHHNQQFFSNQKPSKRGRLNEQDLGTNKGIIYQMRKDALDQKKKYKQAQDIMIQRKKIEDRLVELTLYMSHRDWRSQYIYVLLNYHKLGFKIISDYEFLDGASYMLQLRHIKNDADRWPTIRAIVGLNPKVVVTGMDKIQEFFFENFYFPEKIDQNNSNALVLKQHLDQMVLPYMDSLLWHPTLTYQTTMHTEKFYFTADQKSYRVVGVLRRNISAVAKAVFLNLCMIFKEKERYLKSKEKLTFELRSIAELYLTKKQYLGGDKPNFADFYLYAKLRTNWNSKAFKDYLINDISSDFRSWLYRMGWKCQYVPERVTLL